ncbi:MAG: GspH/FimT family pseudopilin [Rhodocyclales bacterium]|nr:GspH/FimT family pseudopilin [Rhodocyclales bacterium]
MNANKNTVRKSNCQTGFTLVELLIAIAVLGILMSIALPNLSQMLRRIQVNSLTGELSTSFQQARNEAITKNARVLTCASNSGGTGCASSTDWNTNGWLVCLAIGSATACDASTAEIPNPISRHESVPTSTAVVAGPSTPVAFTSNGGLALGSATITVTITGPDSTSTTVTIQPTGFVRATRL